MPKKCFIAFLDVLPRKISQISSTKMFSENIFLAIFRRFLAKNALKKAIFSTPSVPEVGEGRGVPAAGGGVLGDC